MATSRIVDHVGRVLGGRYRLHAPVGTGASAHVYVADDTVLRRRVAVKLLHAALAGDETFLRRFRAEAHAAAALTHPHVMRVFDWGEDDDGPFLVLEYLGGGSLRDLLDRGHRLSHSQAVSVGIEAARALDYAHRRGLVHRDIKPANLLFDEEGRVCIADFGLARALAEAAWTEPSGALLGTARYASPEQARGLSVDGRADVYALALVLVEAITGRVPFTADTTIATLMARTVGGLEPPDEVGPLAPVLAGAGTLDPDDRLDAAALVAGLDAVARDLPRPAPLPLEGPRDDTVVIQRDADPTVIGTLRPPVYDHETDADTDGGYDDAADAAVVAEKRRRRWPKVLIALLLIAGLVGGGAYAWNESQVPSVRVPSVRGMTEDQAKAAVVKAGFKFRVEKREFRDGTVAGTVLNQDPATGTAKEGSTIEVIVSRGPPPVGVPDLAGVKEDEARARLAAAGLVVGEVKRPFSETVAKDIVMEWSPKGEEIPKGSAVALTVSAGPEPRRISDWRNKTFEEAKAGLEGSGLVVRRVDAFSDDVEAGRVVRTEPGNGQQAPKGSTVTVVVSKGPDMVVVPDVRGNTVEEATTKIEAAGLRVTNVFGPPRRRVLITNPGAGTKVKRGAGVDLYTG